MTVIAIGLNHRSAPLDVLERIAIPADGLAKALSEITGSEFVNEAVVLSTCNRTEVYLHAERFHDAYHDVRDALATISGIDLETFVDHLYVHYQDEAVRHLFGVSAGLDSAVLGEHEILGQVKTAWEAARSEGAAGSLLGQLFEHAISCGKRVRTDTGIGRSTASLSHAAVSLVGERVDGFDGLRVLLVGAGDVGSGVATAIAKAGAVRVEVVNRSADRAQGVADSIGGSSVDFADVAASIAEADVVIAATSAPGYVIGVDQVAAARAGRTAPLLVLDLALPRDVDPAVGGLDGVELLVLADLQEFANRGIEQRQTEAVAARQVVAADLERYREASSARQVAPLIGSMHQRADDLRAGEIARYRTRLGELGPEQIEAIDAMTRAMVAKLLHEPSVRLKKAAGTRRGDRLAEAARELFDLP